MAPKLASIHIDMDSPDTLLRFWGLDGHCHDLDGFHERAMTRALDLLRTCGIPATFFCIGEELEKSPAAAALIQQAHREGHEIANHTYSHPFGLTALSAADIGKEVRDCSDAIRRVTGVPPAGFRSPGYEVNATVLEILEGLGMEYDSSAFWSVLNPVMRLYRRAVPGGPVHDGFGEASMSLPRHIYYPANGAWTKPGPARPLVEIPLPRTRLANLPFYSNFHLATGALYRAMAVARMNEPYFVYLVHLVEFTDLSDGLPAPLGVHPNVRTAAAVKIRTLADTIGRITARYRIVRSADAVRDFKAGTAGTIRHAVGAV
jgi:peptidoglycan/xylan/chitin deacetylase (PgdA/CDA1 family)